MRTLDDLDVEGKRVLVRVDFNVPLDDSDPAHPIADDTRIRAARPTLEELLKQRGARQLVLVAHLGRPKGQPDPALSLAPVAERLHALMAVDVKLVASGADVPREPEIVMLENIRFEPGETKNDPELTQRLADYADVYVNDAFGAAHRAHASTEGVAHLLPHAAGRLLQREVQTLTKILEEPQRPFVAIVGGAKVTDKIGVLRRFLDIADTVLIGGAMAFPFLSAQGHEVGGSLCAQEDVAAARELVGSKKLRLPVDMRLGRAFDAGTETRDLDGVDVPDGWMGLDIGPRTAVTYAEEIAAAGTVFWNGPMGAFELAPFADGTRVVAEAVAGATGTTIVGGGDSAAALVGFGLSDQVTHLSTGGGASMLLVEGKPLPGVEALA